MGRLLPHEPALLPSPGLEVWLMKEEEARVAPVETGGVFTFEEIEPGEYSVAWEWKGEPVLAQKVKIL